MITSQDMADMSVRVTDRARLITLFDAACDCAVDLALWERDEPEAATTLALWASSRSLATERRGSEAYPVFEARTSRHRSICVYLRATPQQEAA